MSWVPPAVTTDVTPLGKYEPLTSTGAFLARDPQGSQQKETTGITDPRQRRPDQCRQRNGAESAEEAHSRQTPHASKTPAL